MKTKADLDFADNNASLIFTHRRSGRPKTALEHAEQSHANDNAAVNVSHST